MFVDEIAPITGTQDGSEILTLGRTTEGDLSGIDTNAKLYSVGRDGVCLPFNTRLFERQQLLWRQRHPVYGL